MTSLLTNHAGYWSLVVFSIQIYSLLYLLWLRTNFNIFPFFLRKLSWMMPFVLYISYRIGDGVPSPRSIHNVDQLYVALIHIFIRDTEILGARGVPFLTTLIGFLAVLPYILGFFGLHVRTSSSGRQE